MPEPSTPDVADAVRAERDRYRKALEEIVENSNRDDWAYSRAAKELHGEEWWDRV